MNTSYGSFLYVLPPVMGFFVMIALALVSMLRAGKNPANILFAVICFLGGIINMDMALVSVTRDMSAILWIDRAVHFLFVFIIPIYIQFIHTFLGIAGRRWLEKVAYVASIFLLFFIPTPLYINGYQNFFFGTIAHAGPAFHIFSAAVGFSVVYCLTILTIALKDEKDNHKRNRIKYILGGMGLSSFLLLFNVLPVSGFEFYPLGNFSFIPAVFLAFGVLKYDLLDIGTVLKKGGIYFTLTGILTILYVLIIYTSNALFMGFGDKHSLVLPFVFALMIVLIFNPLKAWVQHFIDRLFFRGKYDYRQILKKTSGDMASLMKFSQIKTLILDSISEALQVTRVCLILFDAKTGVFHLHENNHKNSQPEEARLTLSHSCLPLAGYFRRHKDPLSKSAAEREFRDAKERKLVLEWFDSLQCTLIVPMIYKDQLTGMIILGQKRSGELFVHEDLELLVTIANQSVTAIENAKIYEELETFNRDLEEKIQQRTQDLRQALEEKEKTQQQLIRSESLAAIGQLVAGTAHELNNPLTSASSLIQTSLDSFSDGGIKDAQTAEIKDDLQYALKEIRRAGGIVGSLLGLSRQTRDYVEPVDVNRLIDDALRVLFNQYKYLDVEIEKIYDESLPTIDGNFANLGQVFINVIQNALQALPEGKGKISLSTRYDEKEDRIVAECRDTGAGIDPGELKDIFKPFFTTKAVGKGTGLGLYISHEIIKRHDGVIHVASEKGRGTRFSIEIPCKRRAA
ncbi:MAG: GAF domain-containing protein [Deltaproteobacteria bacterium]|nr:GAF domain-containing protein [Deltaproteobacteria bacterium]